MRTNVLLFLPAAACTLLAACNRNDANTRPPELSGEAIRFEMSIPTTRTVTGADFKTEWSTGDRIGLYAVPAGEPLQSTDNPFHNVALTYDGRLWSGEETVFWPDDHASLDFYAYYPYDEAADDPAAIAFAVRLDQSATTEGKSHYGLSDLMTARSEGATKGKTVALSFAHALSMVQVSVAAGPYKSMGADESLTVTLAGVRPHAVLNLAGTTPTVTLAETDNTPTTVTMHFVEQPQDAPRTAYMFRALLPAQTLDVQFSFEHDNRLFFRDTDPESAVETVAGQVEAFKRRLPDNLYQTVLCKAATFRMGANDRNLWEDKIHDVTLTSDFHITRYEITNIQYAAFLNDAGVDRDGMLPSGRYPDQILVTPHMWGVNWTADEGWLPAEGYADYPAINVSWYGADEFARWAGGALPTDAQWEYACRAGSNHNYPHGEETDRLTDYAWYGDNSMGCTEEVGTKLPNDWMLYDMIGNAVEWVSDWLYYDGTDLVVDPEHTAEEFNEHGLKLVRGGHYGEIALKCWAAQSDIKTPDTCDPTIGFRIIFPL